MLDKTYRSNDDLAIKCKTFFWVCSFIHIATFKVNNTLTSHIIVVRIEPYFKAMCAKVSSTLHHSYSHTRYNILCGSSSLVCCPEDERCNVLETLAYCIYCSGYSFQTRSNLHYDNENKFRYVHCSIGPIRITIMKKI